MKIGVLLTGRPPETLLDELGDYGAFFERLLAGQGFAFETFPVLDGTFPDGPHLADGWIITGSKFGVYEDLPWISPLKALIREIFESGRPLVGICFGHQIMAEALGGKAEKFAGGWSIGAVPYQLTDGSAVTLHAYHQDQVTTPPPGSETFAATPHCAHAGLRYRENTVSLQPHPEFDADYMTALLDARAGNLSQPIIDAARASLGAEVATTWAIDVIAAALKAGTAQGGRVASETSA